MKRGLVALIAIMFVAGCGPSKLVVKTEAQGNILENIQLKYSNPNSQQPLDLRDNERVTLDDESFQTFYVDLSQTSRADHIKLVSEMRNGLKVLLVFRNPENGNEIKRVEVPMQGIEGYRQENTVIYTYNRRGERVGERVEQGEREAFGDQEYTDTSRIPLDISFPMLQSRENRVQAHLLLDYSSYEQPRDANTTEFEREELETNEDGETVVNVTHTINYREQYFQTPRRSRNITFTIIKPAAMQQETSDLDEDEDSLEPATSDEMEEEEEEEGDDDDLGLEGIDDL